MYSKVLVLAVSIGLCIPSAMASTRKREDPPVSDVVATMKKECSSKQSNLDCGSMVECKWQHRSCMFDPEGIPHRAFQETLYRLGVFVMGSMILVFIAQLGTDYANGKITRL